MLEDFVYIAGRYGDGDDFTLIEERINRVRQHARELAMAGIPYYAPHLNSAHFDRIAPAVPRDFWIRQNAAFLERAWGGLVVTHEWQDSTGTQAEVAALKERRRPVYWTEGLEMLIARWRRDHD